MLLSDSVWRDEWKREGKEMVKVKSAWLRLMRAVELEGGGLELA